MPVLGTTRWLLVNCCFADLPAQVTTMGWFQDLISETAKGRFNLFDFFHDMSSGKIDLTGSKAIGPFPMQYTFLEHGRLGRGVWIEEAKRLAREHGENPDDYFAVIAVVNGNVDDSASGGNLAMAGAVPYGQRSWRRCQNCAGLYFAGHSTHGVCSATHGPHVATDTEYGVVMTDGVFPGQASWQWCRKCELLAFNQDRTGPCPAGGLHDHAASADYTVMTEKLYFGEDDWRWCSKCQGLFWQLNPGVCAADGKQHEGSASGAYRLLTGIDHFSITFAAHEMGHCYGLWHACSADSPVEVEYGDRWDIMGGSPTFTLPVFGLAGGAFSTPSLEQLGWIDDRDIWIDPRDGKPSSTTLEAVHAYPSGIRYPRMAKSIGPGITYTAELRLASGWDRGAARGGVVIHQLRTTFSAGQADWAYCSLCHVMFFQGGPSVCPSWSLGHQGGGSAAYSAVTSAAVLPDALDRATGWAWCAKCGNFVTHSLGPCAAGGSHDPSKSEAYLAIVTAAKWPPNGFPYQDGWLVCDKCQSIYYSLADGGTCAGGGTHSSTWLADYGFAVGRDDPRPFVVSNGGAQEWQAGESFVDEARNIRIDIVAIDTARGLAVVEFRPAISTSPRIASPHGTVIEHAEIGVVAHPQLAPGPKGTSTR
jgi:hypothetical protein